MFQAFVALMPDAWGKYPGGVEFAMSVRSQKGGRLRRKRFVHPTRFRRHRRWTKFRANLGRFANQDVEIVISSSVPAGTTADFAWAVWGDPIILSRESLSELLALGRGYLKTYRTMGMLKRVLSKFWSVNCDIPEPKHAYPFWLSNDGPRETSPGSSHEAEVGMMDRHEQWPQPPTSVARSLLTLPKDTIPVKLSVVISTMNGMSQDFESTLRAVRRQKGIPSIEVVVADAGSTDGTLKFAEDHEAKVCSTPPDEIDNRAAQNFGAEHSSGEFIVFMVQDAIPATEDLFYQMAKALLSDSKLAGVTMRTVPKSTADFYACWEIWHQDKVRFEAPLPMLRRPGEMDGLPSQLEQPTALEGVCSMVRRQFWKENGLKPAPLAEDGGIGPSRRKEGYAIGFLPHRAVIHSPLRPAIYYLSRNFFGRLERLRLLQDDSQATWAESLTPDQLFSSCKDLYLAINESTWSLKNSSKYDNSRLSELLSHVSTRQGFTGRANDQRGEPTLDEFFTTLEPFVRHDLPHGNPCIQTFRGTINSMLQFSDEVYPHINGTELLNAIYKAYAGVVGTVCGEYCFRERQQGASSGPLERLADILRKGMRR